MTGQRPSRIRRRREQLEAMLAGGQARLERARSRSMVVDTMVGVVRRERPVAVGILAASLAFRLFAMMIPLIYVLVAGLGFAAQASAGKGSARPGDELADLVVASVADATTSSERARWLALILGGVATLVAAAAVLEVLRWVHLLAWRMAPSRSRASARLVLGLIAGVAVVGTTSTLAEQARADAKGLATELTVILLSAGVQVAVLAVLWLAPVVAVEGDATAPRAVPWTSLVRGRWLLGPGSRMLVLRAPVQPVVRSPGAARASTLYGSLGWPWSLLVPGPSRCPPPHPAAVATSRVPAPASCWIIRVLSLPPAVHRIEPRPSGPGAADVWRSTPRCWRCWTTAAWPTRLAAPTCTGRRGRGHGGVTSGSPGGSGSRRTSTSSRPRAWMRSSSPYRAAWSWTGPWITVSTGSTDARMPSKAAISESVRRPLTRIS